MAAGRDLFVSHSSKDRGVANALCEALASYGVSLWFSSGKDRSEHGANWSNEIQDALNSARNVLLLITEESIASKHVETEILEAIKQKKNIYVLSLENEAKTLDLLRRSRFPDLQNLMIHREEKLERTESRDLFDECARKVSLSLSRRERLGNLKTLIFTSLIAAGLVFSDTLLLRVDNYLEQAKQSVVTTKPAVVDSTSGRSKAASARKEAPQVSRQGVASAPASERIQNTVVTPPKVFRLPNFVRTSLPLRSRMSGSWSVDGAGGVLDFNMSYVGGLLVGQVTLKGSSGFCQFNLKTQKLEDHYITLIPTRNAGGCTATMFHLGYRNEERIQIIIEGGSLANKSWIRDL